MVILRIITLILLVTGLAPILRAQPLSGGWGYLITLTDERSVADLYTITIVTTTGKRFSGYLYDLNESQLLYTRDNPNKEKTIRVGVVMKGSVEKIALYAKSGWYAAPLEGAIIGAAAVGYLTLRSLQKYPPRSPLVFGLNLTLASTGGAGLGLIVGSAIQKVKARPILRLTYQSSRNDNLTELLKSYSYQYQVGVMNRIPE